MKIRCELHLGNVQAKVILVARPEETAAHLALKLAGLAMFLPLAPVVEPSSNHPSLGDLDVKPDVMVLGVDGGITHWIECGVVSINKLDKIVRRLHSTRIIVLKKNLREAHQLREFAAEQIRQSDRIEIWTWPEGQFETWLSALEDKTELFGDCQERSFNLVINSLPYAVDLVSC